MIAIDSFGNYVSFQEEKFNINGKDDLKNCQSFYDMTSVFESEIEDNEQQQEISDFHDEVNLQAVDGFESKTERCRRNQQQRTSDQQTSRC